MCIIPHLNEPPHSPLFALTHTWQAGMPGRGGSFVPNDISLGGGSTGSTSGSGTDTGRPPFIVLSGPNMGGKSTMLRQCCLAALMAQVWVPPLHVPPPPSCPPP